MPEEVKEREIDLSEILKDIEKSEYNDYKQLVYLGKIVDTYEVFGHEFKVHSLNAEEELKLASFLFSYQDTLSYTKAMYIECLSYCIDEVDGKPLAPPPLEVGEYDPVPAKREVIRKWSPLVLAEIYDEVYLDLRLRERAVVDHVKKSQRVGRKSIPSDSHKEEVSS